MENKQGKELGRKLQREKIQAIGDVMRMPRGKLAFVCMDWLLMDCFVKLVKCLTKCQDLRSGGTSLAASQRQPSCEVGIMMPWGAPIDLTLRSPQHPFACWRLVLVGYLTSASFYLSLHLRNKHVYHGNVVRSSYYEWEGPPTLTLRQLLRATKQISSLIYNME